MVSIITGTEPMYNIPWARMQCFLSPQTGHNRKQKQKAASGTPT